MQIYSTYKVKIKHYNHIFKETVAVYRNAVDYLLEVCNENWEEVSQLNGNMGPAELYGTPDSCNQEPFGSEV